MQVFYQGHFATIRRLARKDLTALYAQQAVTDVLSQYRPGFPEGAFDAHFAADRLEWLARLSPEPEVEALVLHRRTQTPLGFMCLSSLDPVNAKAELSIGFFRGRGSRPALEALHWVLEAAFYKERLRKLIFYVYPTNTAALTILDALGAKLEATLRDEVRLTDGDFGDLLRYCLFQNDWDRSTARQRLQRLVPLADTEVSGGST